MSHLSGILWLSWETCVFLTSAQTQPDEPHGLFDLSSSFGSCLQRQRTPGQLLGATPRGTRWVARAVARGAGETVARHSGSRRSPQVG